MSAVCEGSKTRQVNEQASVELKLFPFLFSIIMIIFHMIATVINEKTKSERKQKNREKERRERVKAVYEMPTDTTIKTNVGKQP